MTRAPRAVRRPRALAALAAGLVSGVTGCAGIGQPAPYDSTGINGLVVPTPTPTPTDFVEGVDNPWLPLADGAAWSYVVTDDGRRLGVIGIDVLPTLTTVAGLAATAVRTSADIGGDEVEETRFYAQDRDGNVWLVGADAGDVSWRAGTDGARAGLAMPADPRLGDGWLAYEVPGLPRASETIEDQSSELVQVRNEAGSATTRTVYEKGVGLVALEDLDAGWTAGLVER